MERGIATSQCESVDVRACASLCCNGSAILPRTMCCLVIHRADCSRSRLFRVVAQCVLNPTGGAVVLLKLCEIRSISVSVYRTCSLELAGS